MRSSELALEIPEIRKTCVRFSLTFLYSSRTIQKLFMSEIGAFSHAKSENSVFTESLELDAHELRYRAGRLVVRPEHHVPGMAHSAVDRRLRSRGRFRSARQGETFGSILVEAIGISIAILRMSLAAFIRGGTATGDTYERLRALEVMQ